MNCQNDYSLVGFNSFLSRAKPDIAPARWNYTEVAVTTAWGEVSSIEA